MATSNYPSGLDDYSVLPSSGQPISVGSHYFGPAITNVEAELGTDPAGTFTDVKSRLDAGGVGTAISVNASAPDSSLTIDANGHVFRNNLPAFNVKNSASSSAFAANTTATWDVENLDNNNDFDLANNRFVAPVDGVYYLGARILSNSGTQVLFSLQINSLTAGGSYAENTSNTGFREIATFGVFNLSSGDHVTVYVQSFPAHGADYANFCGYLIG